MTKGFVVDDVVPTIDCCTWMLSEYIEEKVSTNEFVTEYRSLLLS